MDFFNADDKTMLEKFIRQCMEKDILELKRRIHRVWDAQEEMMHNNLMIINRNNQMLYQDNPKNVEYTGGECPKLAENYLLLEEALAELERIVPKAYSIWIELFENGKEMYLTDPIHNLVMEGSACERTFDNFGQLYLNKPGFILDIGCGPQAVPYYLRNFPIEYIYGIDPLLPFEKHPFHFMKAIAEFIPYEDESFDYIISATSLDHVLLLDKALNEMYRVLKQEGVLLIWAGTGGNYTVDPKSSNMDGYNPYREDVSAVDTFHMFHIGPIWFEKMMNDKWDKESHYSDREGNHFYAFKKR